MTLEVSEFYFKQKLLFTALKIKLVVHVKQKVSVYRTTKKLFKSRRLHFKQNQSFPPSIVAQRY